MKEESSRLKGERAMGMGSGFPYCRYCPVAPGGFQMTEDGRRRTDDGGRGTEGGGWVIGFVVLGI